MNRSTKWSYILVCVSTSTALKVGAAADAVASGRTNASSERERAFMGAG